MPRRSHMRIYCLISAMNSAEEEVSIQISCAYLLTEAKEIHIT